MLNVGPMITARLANKKRNGHGKLNPLCRWVARAELQRPVAPHSRPGAAPRNWAKPAAFTTEGDQLPGMAGPTAHAEKTVLQAATFQVILEFALDSCRVRLDSSCLMADKGGR